MHHEVGLLLRMDSFDPASQEPGVFPTLICWRSAVTCPDDKGISSGKDGKGKNHCYVMVMKNLNQNGFLPSDRCLHGSHACSREGPALVGSALPPSDDMKEQIYKLAKKGLTPSQTGVILRDSHGVAQVRFVTGNQILRILKSKRLAPSLPEDLYHWIKKVVAVQKHLERNRKDAKSD
ncbi:hypothetical protein GH733_017659 [Mirounga leonina]|nr:hypothetical protein GH733_017659 [Mirounga leonina]